MLGRTGSVEGETHTQRDRENGEEKQQRRHRDKMSDTCPVGNENQERKSAVPPSIQQKFSEHPLWCSVGRQLYSK